MNRFLRFFLFLAFSLFSFISYGQEKCNNGIDDDGDGIVDCADGDCQFAANIEKGCNCADGIDNDGDGNIDNKDSNCASFYGLEFVGDDESCDGFDSGSGGGGTFTFLGAPLLTAQNTFDTQSKVAIGDVNCDGIPDVIATSKFNQEIRVIATTNGQPGNKDIGDVIQDFKLTGQGATIFPNSDKGKFFFELEILIADIDRSCPVEIYSIVSSRSGNGNNEPTQYYLVGFRANPTPSTSTLVPLFDAVPLGTDRPGSLGIADFDCDGEAEVFIKDQIYDALTGELLADGNIGNWDTSVNSAPVVADIIPGGNLEMVVGNILYQVPNLPDGSTQSLTVLQDMNTIDITKQWYPKTIFDAAEYGLTNYSSTSIADVNNDGNLDIVMSGALNSNAGSTAVFFWDITNGTVDVFLPPDPVYPNGWPWGTSRVNLGDIDGDGKLELTFIAGNRLFALEESGGSLSQKWFRTINDSKSGVVSTTVYDFDNDGSPEVVYRDAQELVVIDGLTGQTVLWSTPCQSHTNTEGPLIADVNGDGSTDMCVTCATANFDINDPIQQQALGQMRCFFSEENNWLPTRKVWNQQGYAAVNIGDDLSVPCPSFDMTASFSGDCDGDGTPEINRPLNTFMNQVPTFGADGCPYFPAPDISFVGNDPTLEPGDPGYVDPSDPNYFPAIEFTRPTCGDLGIEVGFNIINSGSLAITDNLDISFWEGDPSAATDPQTGQPAVLLHTSVLALNGLQVGDTLSQSGILFDYSGTTSTIYIVLNDDGTEFPIDLTANEFSECFIDNNIFAFPISPEPFTVEIEKISDNSNCNAGVSGVETGELRAVVKRNGVEVADLSPYAFQWYDGPDTLSTLLPNGQGGNADRATDLGNGDYTVVVTNIAKGCSSLPISETIIQTAQTPDASIQVNSNQTQCTPPNGELEVIVVGDLTGITFDWRDEFGTPLGITGPVASDLDEGGYAVIVTRNGCPLQLDANITGPLVPDVTASVTQNITSCADLNSGAVTSEVFLTGVLQDPNLYTFKWYFYDIATSTLGSILPPANGTGPSRTGLAAGDYAVFATQNSTGCQSTLPAIVSIVDNRVYPVATVVEIAPQTSCDPAQPNGILEVQITLNGVADAASNYTIEWFRGDNTLPANLYGNTSADNSQALEIEGGGIPYTVKVTDANGCFDTDKLSVSENVLYPIPTLTKISDNNICDPTLASSSFNGEISLSMTFDGANVTLPDPLYEITWYSGGNTAAPVIAVADNSIPTLTGLNGGQQYTATITRTDLFCASVPVTVNVANIQTPPVFTFTMNPSTTCTLPGNGSVTVNTVEGAAFNSVTHTINWYDGNAVKFSAGVRTPDGTNTTTYVGSGLATGDEVLLEVINNTTGCSITQLNTITNAAAKPTFTYATDPNGICDPTISTDPLSGEIRVTLDAYANGLGTDTYTYTFVGPAGTVSNATGTLSNIIDGSYTVTAMNDRLRCTSDPVAVTVAKDQTPPVFTFTMNPSTTCTLPGNGSVTVNTVEGAAFNSVTHTINWYDGNAVKFSAGVRTPDGTNTTTYVGSGLATGDEVLLEVINNTTGCSITQLNTITNAAAKPTFTYATDPNGICDPTISTDPLSGEIRVTLDAYANGLGTDTYTYTFVGPAGTVSNATGTLSNIIDGSYTVTAMNDRLRCTSDPVAVTVAKDQTPPVFTFTMNPSTTCTLPGNGSVTVNTVEGAAFNSVTHTINWYDGNAVKFSAGVRTPDGTNTTTYVGSGLATGDEVLLEVINNTTGCSITQLNTITNAAAKPTFTYATDPNGICDPTISTDPLSGEIRVTLDAYANGLGTDTYTYTFVGPAGTVSNATGTLSNIIDGSYTVTAMNDRLRCTSDPVAVTVAKDQTPPVFTFTMNPSTTCTLPGNGSVTVNTVEGAAFNSVTHTINWYDGNAVKFSAGVRTPDGTNTTTYVGSGLATGDEVLLEVINNTTGCSITQLNTITNAAAKPTFTYATDPNGICDPTISTDPLSGEIRVTLDAYANGLGTDTYTYTFVGPAGTVSNATGTLSNIIDGSYTVTAMNDRLRCTSDPVAVTVAKDQTPPVFTFTMNPSTTCTLPGNGSVTVNTVEGAAFNSVTHTINWYDGNAVKFSAGVRTPDGTNTTTYVGSGLATGDEVLLEVINNTTGCSITQLNTITNAAAKPTFTYATDPNGICDPTISTDPLSGEIRVTLDAYANGLGTDTYTYTFVGPAGTVSNATGTLSNIIDGSYTVTAMNDRLRCTSDPVAVTVAKMIVTPVISETITPSTNCPGSTDNGSLEIIDINGSAPNLATHTINWYDGNSVIFVAGVRAPTSTGIVYSSIPGDAKYTVEVINKASGCSTVETYTLPNGRVDPVTNLNSSQPNSICDPSLTSPTVEYNGQISITTTDTNGQVGDTYTFVWTNKTTGNQVQVDYPNADIQNVGLTSTLDLIPGGTYTVTVMNDVLGCTSTPKDFTITNTQVLPTPVINLDQQQTSCGTPNGQLTVAVPGANTYQYEWFVGSGTTTPFVDGTNGTISNGDRTISGLAGNTRYTVRITDLTSGCQDIGEELVTENIVLPVISEVGNNPNTTCDVINLGPTGDLEIDINGGAVALPSSLYDFTWYTGPTATGPATTIDGDLVTSGSPTLGNLTEGKYTWTVTELATGCTSLPVTVTIAKTFIQPTITTSFVQQTSCDYTNNPNGEMQVIVNGQVGHTFRVDWFIGNDVNNAGNLINTNTNVPTATPIIDDGAGYPQGDYTVLVYDEITGCTTQESISITQNIVNPVVTLTPTDHTDCTFDGLITPNKIQGAASNYQFIWHQGQTTAGTVVLDVTTTFGSGSEILNQTNVQAYGTLANLYSDYYTLEVIDVDNLCVINEITSFIAPNPPQLNIKFKIIERPSDCALAEGVLTAYIDLDNDDIIDPGETDYTSFNFEWYEGLSSDPNPNFIENTVDSYFASSAIIVDVADRYTTGPVPGGVKDVTYFAQEDPTHGATIYDQESNTFTVVITDLTGSGCTEIATVFLPFVDSQVTTFIGKTDDTDCDPLVGNGTIEVIINEADGSLANQSLFEVLLYDTQTPVLGVTAPVQTIQRGGYVSDFSVDEDGWAPFRGFTTGNVDGVFDGVITNNDVLEFDAQFTLQHYIESDLFVPGNNYNVTFDIYIPAGQPQGNGFRVFNIDKVAVVGNFILNQRVSDGYVAGTWQSYSINIPSAYKTLRFFMYNGNNIAYTASAGTDYLYIKNIVVTDLTIPSTTFSNLTPGNYSVVSQQDFGSGCFSELLSVTIEDAAKPPVLTPTITQDTWCDNSGTVGDGEITVVPSLDPLDIASIAPNTVPAGRTYSYLWSTTATVSANGAITPTISGLAPGIYTVTVTDTDTGCEKTVDYEIVDQDVDPAISVFSLTNSDRCDPNENGEIAIDANDILPQSGVPTLADYNFTLYLIDETTNVLTDVTATATLVNADPVLTFQDLVAGTYYIEIEILNAALPGFGCVSPPIEAGEILDVSIGPVLTDNISIDNSCDPVSNGEIQIIADNGTPSAGQYIYNWYIGNDTTTPFNDPVDGTIYNPGDIHPINGLVADNEGYISNVLHGNYTAEVFDPVSNCFTIKTYTVDYVPLLPSITITASSQTSCDALVNGQIDVTGVSVDAIGDYEYELYAGLSNYNSGIIDESDVDYNGTVSFTGKTAGTYYVVANKVSGASGGVGCSSSPVSAVIVDETVKPDISITPSFNTSCDGNFEGSLAIQVNTTGGPGDDTNNPVYTYTVTGDVTGALVGPFTGNGNALDANSDGIDDDGDNDIIGGLQDDTYTVIAVNGITGCSITGQATIVKVEEPIIVQTVAAVNQTTCDLTIAGGSATVTGITPLDVNGVGNTIIMEYDFTWYAGNLGDDFTTASGLTPPLGDLGINASSINQLPEGTYYVVATRKAGFAPGSGCDSPPFRVDILDQSVDPTFTITPFAETSCDGSGEGSITIDNITGVGPYDITITGGVSGVVTNLVGYDYGVSGPYTETGLGVDTYSAVVLDQGTGCSTTGVTEILLSQQPIIITAATSTDLTICSPLNGTATVTGVTPLGGALATEYSFEWYETTPGGGFGTAALRPEVGTTINGLGAGTYYVKAIRNVGFNPGAGCESAPFRLDVFDVSVDPTFTITSFAETSCDGSGEGSITIDNITGVGPYDITITGGVSGVVTNLVGYDYGVSGPYTETGLGVDTYSAVVLDQGTGCSTTGVTEILLSQQPIIITAATSTDLTICSPLNGTATVTGVTPLGGALATEYSFEWYETTPGGGFGTAALRPEVGTTINGLGAGTYYVKAIRNVGFNPGAGCESAPFRLDVFDVSVDPTFTITPFAETSCDGSGEGSITIDNITGVGPYDITITGGVSGVVTNLVGYDYGVSGPYTETGLGVDTYSAVVLDQGTGCSTTGVTEILLSQQPIIITAATSTDLTICSPLNGTATVTGVTPLGGALATEYSFEWYETTPGGGFGTAALRPEVGTTINGLGAGTYYVKAIRNVGFNPGAGCESAPFRLDVFDVSVDPTFTITPFAETSCDGSGEGSITIDNITGVGPYDITITGGVSGVVTNLVGYDYGVSGPYTETGLGVDTYSAVVLDQGTGCSTTGVTEILLSQQPIIITAATSTDLTICSPLNGTATVTGVTPLGGALATEYSFEWYETTPGGGFGTAALRPEVGTTINGLGAGTYYVKAIRNVGFNPGAGCESAPFRLDVFDVSVDPTFTITPFAETSCDGSGEGSITIDNITGVGPYDITITGGVSGVVTNLVGYDYGVSGPYTETGLGVDTYSAVVLDQGTGCSTTGVTEILLSQQPIIITAATSTDLTLCSPLNGTATVTGVTPLGGALATEYSFEWYETTPGGGFGTAALRPEVGTTINGLGAGTYYVKAIRNVGFNPGAGCESAPFRLDVFDLSESPILSFTQPEPDVNCFDDPTQGNGSVTVSSNVNIVTWNWFERDLNGNGIFNEAGFDDLPVSANEIITPTSNEYMGLAPGVYNLMVTDANGCTNTTQISIPKEASQSTPNVVNVDVLLTTNCGGNGLFEVGEISIGDPFDGTNPNASITDSTRLATEFVYQWFNGSVNLADTLAYEHGSVVDSVAAGTYYVIVTSLATLCESIPKEVVMQEIDINYPNLSLVQTVPQLGCESPFSGELTATVTENDPTDTDDLYRFVWTFEGSAILPPGSTGPVDNANVSVIGGLPVGRYDVTVFNDSTGCSVTALYIIEDESPEFKPVINTGTEPVTNCLSPNGGIFGKAVPFTDANGVNTYPLLPYDYDIDIYAGDLTATLDENSPPGDLASISGTSAGVNLVAPNVPAGFYTVRVIDNKTGCFSVKSDQVLERLTAPQVVVVEDNPLINCDPALANGQLSATADNGRVGGYTFEWYSGNAVSGAIISSRNKLIGQLDGQFTVRVTNNLSGCFTDATGVITDSTQNAPTPTPLLIADRQSCFNPDGELSVSVGGQTAGYTFEWYDQGAGGGSNFSNDVHIRNLDVSTYSVIAYDIVTGCDSEPVDIDIADKRLNPEFTFETVGSICDEGTGVARIIITNDVQGAQVSWTYLDNGEDMGLGSEINDLYPGEYEAFVITFYGCEGLGTTEVGTIIQGYNLVTPNGSYNEGENNNFYIECIKNFPNNNVKIFNRAGVLVYQINGYNNEDKSFVGLGENGVYAIGSELPNGTYYYVIDKGDGSKLVAGFLELIR